jgi:hypothetical protein
MAIKRKKKTKKSILEFGNLAHILAAKEDARNAAIGQAFDHLNIKLYELENPKGWKDKLLRYMEVVLSQDDDFGLTDGYELFS